MKKKVIGGIDFEINRYGMLKQVNVQPFAYDAGYLSQQSTTLEMSYLRLGYLLGCVPFDNLRQFDVLELGPGTGVFLEVMKEHVAAISGYDVVAESRYCTLSLDEARERQWDLVCAFDVLEHFNDIDDFWRLQFEWAYLSIPCPPRTGVSHQWRHFKPNEHIWYISSDQFRNWANDHGYDVVASGCPEDAIRKRWDKSSPNINTFVLRRA